VRLRLRRGPLEQDVAQTIAAALDAAAQAVPIFGKFPELLVLAHAVVVGMAEGAIMDIVELAGAGIKQLFVSTPLVESERFQESLARLDAADNLPALNWSQTPERRGNERAVRVKQRQSLRRQAFLRQRIDELVGWAWFTRETVSPHI
jgi:hypothetical protein